jgi:hypothetical protein
VKVVAATVEVCALRCGIAVTPNLDDRFIVDLVWIMLRIPSSLLYEYWPWIINVEFANDVKLR